jgi:hypothetical protein
VKQVPTRPYGPRQLWGTIRRWFGNPALRAYEWRFFPTFWQLRYYWQSLNFWLAKRLYSARSKFRTTGESASIFLLITRTVFWQVFAAALLVAFLEFCDRKLRTPPTPLEWLTLHSIKVATVLAWLHLKSPNAAVSLTTLSTLAQISGLFLGLYFTAISVVAGTNYARVPADILDALVREKVGNLYIRIVALFGGISLILLGASNLGYRPGTLNLALVSLLGIASLFSFVELGRRAFYFFDPTKLVAVLASDILRLAKSATWLGFSWRDAGFQDHYRKQADSDVRIYEDVLLLSNTERHLQGRSLLALVLQFLVLLELYSKEKQRIPSDSRWFERVYSHRTWLTTTESRVNIAIDTGTGLEPDYVADHLWFEKRLSNLISRTLNGLRDRNDFARAITVCTKLQDTLGILASELALEESLFLLQRLKTFAREIAVKDVEDRAGSLDARQALAASLGLADVCGMGFISILIGFADRLEKISLESFSADLDRVDFRRPQGMYRTGLPRKVVEQLEYLHKGIAFEMRVERQQISPIWYCRQIAGLGMARFFVETCDALLAELENTYAVEAEELSALKRYLFASQLIQRGLEACYKFHFRIEKFREWFESFSGLRRVPDIPWPAFEPKKAHERIEAVRNRLLIVLANSVRGIAALPASKEIPDYLGHAFVTLADECYKSMAEGDEGLFGKLFPSFFTAAVAAQERLRVLLRDQEPKTAIVFITEPIEDLLAISGHALVYSELDNKTFWNIVKNFWDNYLLSLPDPVGAIKSVLAAILYRRSLFAILPRDLRRTAWTQDLMNRLRQRGFVEDYFVSRRAWGAGDEKLNHPSALIRTLARGSFISEKAADIFVACYLVERPEAAGLDVPTSVKDLAARIKREAQKTDLQTEAQDETSEESETE